jgi:hypothetical protein
MKKISLLFISAIIFASLSAQVIPNAGMELWDNSSGTEQPTGWSTTNQYAPNTVIKSTDSHSGTYASLLETKTIIIVNVPGIMGTGNFNLTTFTVNGGFPISTAYAQLSGYYKYEPVGADSFWVFSLFTKWNSGNNSRDTLAMANFFGGAAAAYTLFQTDFLYLSPGVPDSALLIVSSTKNPLGGPAGSKLFIDDFDFSGVVGIHEVAQQTVTAYPSPANDKFVIRLSNISEAKQIIISDVLGNKVATVPVQSYAVNVNTSLFSDGIYLYQVTDNVGKLLSTGKFSVKH